MHIRALILVLVVPACMEEGDAPFGAEPGAGARHGNHALDRGWIVESDQADALLGTTVASAGDVNGDGFDDVIVGAPGFDDGLVDQGKAFVYHGSPTGPSLVPDWTETGDKTLDAFGTSVASAGDVNGDGFDDVIVGAKNFLGDGAIYAYYGSATGLDPNPSWTVLSPVGGLNFGESVASAGDVNGDGFDDVIACDHRFRQLPNLYQTGRVVVYLGSATGLQSLPVWELLGTNDHNLLVPVASAGDVNGDGFDDIAVSADEPTLSEAIGRVKVFHGSPTGPGVLPAVGLHGGTNSYDHFGEAVAAGDLNGDGFGDLVVGASWHSSQKYHSGRVYGYLGGPTGLSSDPTWIKLGKEEEEHFGRQLSSGGDVTGDGIDDFVVASGWWAYYGGPPKAFSLFTTQPFPSRQPLTVVQPAVDFDDFAVSTALGDFDGNGTADVLVGSNLYTDGQLNEGAAFVYFSK